MAIPFLNNISLNNNEIQNVKIHNTANIPSPGSGHIYFDTDDNIAKYYNGSEWISLTADTNDYVDGASLSGTDLILTRTGSLSDLTVDLSSLDELVNDSTITITAGTGLTTGGDFTTNQASNETITIDHANVSRTDTTSTDAPSYGGTFEAVTGVTTNAQGHVTAIDVSTVTIPVSDNIDEDVNTTNLKARLAQLTGNVTITGDNIIIPGDLQVTGTVTTNNVETVSTSNGVIFEGNAADDNEVTLLATTVTDDRTIVLPDASGTVALTSDLPVSGTDFDPVGTDNSIDVTLNGSYDYITISGQTITRNAIDYDTDVINKPTISNTQLATAAALIDVSAMGANTTASFTHGLNSKNLIVQIYEVSTGQVVYADIDHTSVNQISIIFAATPANDIRVVVIDAKNDITDKVVSYS